MNITTDIASFYQQMPTPVCLTDKEGHIVFGNTAALQAFGTPGAATLDSWFGNNGLALLDGRKAIFENTCMARVWQSSDVSLSQELIVRTVAGQAQAFQVVSTRMLRGREPCAFHLFSPLSETQLNEAHHRMLKRSVSRSPC